MRTSGKYALLVSIAICLYFCVSFFREPPPVANVQNWVPSSLPMPQYPLEAGFLASAATGLPDPFRPRFFENPKFKGMSRNPSGGFSAVFLNAENNMVLLSPGQSLDGITILEADSNRCRITFGSSTKDLEVKRK